MSIRSPLTWLIGALLATSCGTTTENLQIAAHEQPSTDVSSEEARAALSPQPVLHYLVMAKLYRALKAQNPELTDTLTRAETRVLAMDRLTERAAHALIFQLFKDKTLDEVAQIHQQWLDNPAQLVAFTHRILDRIEGKSIAEKAAIARSQPAVLIALEDLLPAEPSPMTDTAPPSLKDRLIKGFFGLLAQKDPAIRAQLETLKDAVLKLSPQQMRALHASMWEQNKGKTVAEMATLMAQWTNEPASYVAHLNEHLNRVANLSLQAQQVLLSGYPNVLARYEDILLAD